MNIDPVKVMAAVKPAAAAPSVEQIRAERERLLAKGYDNRNQAAFEKLCTFSAYNRKGSSRRGLVLWGPPGTGKTFAARVLALPRIVSAAEICRRWRENEQACQEWLNPQRFDVLPPGYLDLTIDDMGEEPLLNLFGNKFDAIASLICERYVLWQKHGGKTFLTTNLGPDAIQARYGARVLSRLSEMCSWVEFVGTDRRLEGGW